MGMRALHSKGFMHRDLKPSNILINNQGHALIGDFGTSRRESDDHTLTLEAGTVHYAAPEMFREEPYTNKVDVFSFGSILYEIIVGSPVFARDEPPFPVMRQLLAGDMPRVPDLCGEFMQGLINRCWSQNPECRPSFDEILEEFRVRSFAIFPDANGNTLREYVCGVLAWEVGQPLVSDGMILNG
jgi:serine/threonine protein kinase